MVPASARGVSIGTLCLHAAPLAFACCLSAVGTLCCSARSLNCAIQWRICASEHDCVRAPAAGRCGLLLAVFSAMPSTDCTFGQVECRLFVGQQFDACLWTIGCADDWHCMRSLTGQSHCFQDVFCGAPYEHGLPTASSLDLHVHTQRFSARTANLACFQHDFASDAQV